MNQTDITSNMDNIWTVITFQRQTFFDLMYQNLDWRLNHESVSGGYKIARMKTEWDTEPPRSGGSQQDLEASFCQMAIWKVYQIWGR